MATKRLNPLEKFQAEHDAWTLANPVRMRRIELGLSQMSLASLLDVSLVSIQNWERGSSFPTPVHQAQLAKCLESPRFMALFEAWKNGRPTLP